MTSAQYELGDLTVTTYREADAHTRSAFQALVLRLTPEDGENGPDTWQWVLDNNASFPSELYDTFIFSHRITGEVLATGTFTPDDRGALRDNKIEALGVLGFVNVLRRDLRGRGLGRVVWQFLDTHVQNIVNELGGEHQVYLFTANPSLYARLGFEELELKIAYLDAEETICRKTYVSAE